MFISNIPPQRVYPKKIMKQLRNNWCSKIPAPLSFTIENIGDIH